MSWEGCKREKRQLRVDVLERRGVRRGMQKSEVMRSKQQVRRMLCTRVSCMATSKARLLGRMWHNQDTRRGGTRGRFPPDGWERQWLSNIALKIAKA